MTAVDDLRARLTSALTLELSHAGMKAPADLAGRIAAKAMDKAQVEALLTYVAAADAAGGDIDTVIDGGGTGDLPEELGDRRLTWIEARTAIADDPILSQVLA